MSQDWTPFFYFFGAEKILISDQLHTCKLLQFTERRCGCRDTIRIRLSDLQVNQTIASTEQRASLINECNDFMTVRYYLGPLLLAASIDKSRLTTHRSQDQEATGKYRSGPRALTPATCRLFSFLQSNEHSRYTHRPKPPVMTHSSKARS